MSYRDLQKTCKSHGIKANSKAAVLRTELQKFINKSAPREAEEDTISDAVDNSISNVLGLDADKKHGICLDLQMVDGVSEDEDEAGAAVEDVSAALAKVEISSDTVPVEVKHEAAATPDRKFGTDITTTPTRTFSNSLTTKDILSASKSFAMTPTGKIKCSYTGHEMPATAEAVSTYMSGKKYRKAKVKASFDITEFGPWIVETDSVENPDHVWCTVTNKYVSRDATIIRRHMAGKKFTTQLAKLQNFQKLRGVPTPVGKHTVFNSPKNTPRSDPYAYNVHWNIEEYGDL